MTRKCKLIIASLLLTIPTSGYAEKIQLTPLFPIRLATQVDARATLSGGTAALMDVRVTATLFDARSKLLAMMPQINEYFACTPGAVGAQITNIGLDLIPGNPHALRVTTVASGQRCGPGLNPKVDMTISTTFNAIVSGSKRIELKADAPQVACNQLVSACSLFRKQIIDAITPKINENSEVVGAWIDRQIKQQMDKYQQAPYNLKIEAVNINPAKSAGDVSDLMVQVVLSGRVPVDDLNEAVSSFAP
jgi:hypothetical protein